MPDAPPRFQQVNLVVRDMDAVLAFYRTLGLPIRGGEGEDWPPDSGGRHAIRRRADSPPDPGSRGGCRFSVSKASATSVVLSGRCRWIVLRATPHRLATESIVKAP